MPKAFIANTTDLPISSAQRTCFLGPAGGGGSDPLLMIEIHIPNFCLQVLLAGTSHKPLPQYLTSPKKNAARDPIMYDKNICISLSLSLSLYIYICVCVIYVNHPNDFLVL